MFLCVTYLHFLPLLPTYYLSIYHQAFRTLVVTAIDRTAKNGAVTITAHNVAKLDTTGAVAPPRGNILLRSRSSIL